MPKIRRQFPGIIAATLETENHPIQAPRFSRFALINT
jgi:hypothetical protein